METQQSKSLYLGKLHTVGLNPTIKRALVLIIHPLFIPLTLSSPPAPTSALSLAAAVKVSALNKGVNNVFFKSVWDLKLLETWITAYQIFGAILCLLLVIFSFIFFFLKQVPIYLNCSGKRCITVLL